MNHGFATPHHLADIEGIQVTSAHIGKHVLNAAGEVHMIHGTCGQSVSISTPDGDDYPYAVPARDLRWA